MTITINTSLAMPAFFTRKRTASLLTAMSLLVGLLSSSSASAQPGAQSSQEAKLQEAWRTSMAKIPLPKKGSFVATYPSKEWREVLNTKALPLYPMPPRHGPRPFYVGNGNDVSAQAPSGHISPPANFCK